MGQEEEVRVGGVGRRERTRPTEMWIDCDEERETSYVSIRIL